MSEDLKLCPFCGELPEVVTLNGAPAAICRNEDCGFHGTGGVIPLEQWNQRVASGGWPFRSDEPCRYTGEPEEKAEHPGPFPGIPKSLPGEPSADLKEAVGRRFKMVMGHVRAYGNAQACGNSTEQNGQYMALEDHIQKLVESGLKFAGEGPVKPLPDSMKSSAYDNTPVEFGPVNEVREIKVDGKTISKLKKRGGEDGGPTTNANTEDAD